MDGAHVEDGGAVVRPVGSRTLPGLGHRLLALGLAVTAWLFLAPTARLAAQQRRTLRRPPAYTIDQWTTRDGLPQNSVNAIAQGPAGYLWLGTFGGLVRFDGTDFKVVERTDGTGRRHLDRVLALAFGPDSALWIGTQDAGLLRFKDGRYRVYTTADGLPEGRIEALHVASSGAVWIGMTHADLVRFAGGRFERVADVAGRRFGPAASTVEDGDSRLWAYDGRRVVSVADSARTVLRVRPGPVSGDHAMMLRDRSGAFWFSRDDSLARLSGDAVRYYGVHDADVMVQGARGGYWVGTNNDGLYRLSTSGGTLAVRRYVLPDGRSSFRVRSAYIDRSGDVWIGTNANGLLRARRNLFTTYATEEGLSHDVATALYGDTAGTMWVATNCGGVDAIDPGLRTVRVFNPRSPGDPRGDPCVFSLARGPGGAMWQGSWGGGVSLLSGHAPGWPRHIAGLPDNVVLALYSSHDGTLWVGTRSGGLAAVRDGRVDAVFTTANGLSSDGIRTILQARDGALWIGTLEGADRLADGHVTDTIAAGLHVRAIFEDEHRDLWIGTYGAGLLFCDHRGGGCRNITQRDGLAENVVSAILEDSAGDLWMSGNRGISRVSRHALVALAEGGRRHVRAVLYGAGDGLSNPETNGGFEPAAWKDARGRLWFPTVHGVAVVDPARAASDAPPPPTRVEEVLVDGVPHAPGDTIVVGPGRPNLEFRYAALDLYDPRQVTFRHRLVGFDPHWVVSGTRRLAEYPRLQPGRYRFLVSAANRDGRWSAAGTGVSLRVVPPFWSTWSFRIAVAAGLLGLVAAFLLRRERAARRKQAAREEFSRRLIESQERERRRVAGALHDGLGQQLLVVRNRALLALRGDDAGEAARSQLHEIAEVASESLDGVRSLARVLRPPRLEHLGLTAALEGMIESVGASAGISVDAAVDDIDGLLSPDDDINLYRVAQEALSNVARHSGAATVTVRIRQEGDRLTLSVADDGRGFEPDRHAGEGFGLSSMAERVRILGGRLEVDTALGRGTKIRVSVPTDGTRRAGAVTRDGGP